MALCLTATPALGEEVTHVFDPVLSLRGDCNKNKLDEVLDPGCPYPAPPQGPQPFAKPSGVAVDSLGYTYVTNYGAKLDGSQGQLDIFDPSGHFVTAASFKGLIEAAGGSLEEGNTSFEHPAVDSLGNLYLHLAARSVPTTPPHDDEVLLYTPSSYPTTQSTKYGSAKTIDPDAKTLALDPANNHLYVYRPPSVFEYDSAVKGSSLLRPEIASVPSNSSGRMAIGPNGDIYVAGLKPGAPPAPTEAEPFVSEVYVFDGATGELETTIDGSDIETSCRLNGKNEKECGFEAAFGELAVAVDQANGDLYVQDQVGTNPVYQFRLDEGSGKYHYLSTIEHSFQEEGRFGIAIASGPSNPNQGYLFVVSHPSGVGHLFAFESLPELGPPIVTGQVFSGVTSTEAVLEAIVDPNGAETSYRFQYVDELTYLEDLEAGGPGHGFDHASETAETTLASLNEPEAVSAALTGLAPDTAYRFRVVASNHCKPEEPEVLCTTKGEGKPGGEGEDARFATYPTQTVPQVCSNQQLRTGSSAGLPDCRAYELVTPPNTDGHMPYGLVYGASAFDTTLASPAGDDVVFRTRGGSLPGTEGVGSLDGDPYRARRDGGWQSESAGPSGAQSRTPVLGGISSDHGYSFWTTGGELDNGSLAIVPFTTYLRGPDGSFELVGQGSQDVDPHARGRWISAGAAHVIFTSGGTSGGQEPPAVQLEEDAPPSGTAAIYDRSPGGPTHVVSLLPGDETPSTPAEYQGVSADGRAVAFKLTEEGVTRLYARLDNAETLEVASGATSFGGFSDDGSRLFYLKGGDIFAFDTAGEGKTTQVGSGGASTLVNVPADGSHAYFVSTDQLDGAEGQAGKDNLYVWNGKSIRFIATLDHLDVVGEKIVEGISLGAEFGGLGLWISNVVGTEQNSFHGRASDPSRTTPDGSVIVFESHANLTGYDSQGHREVYRYDAVGGGCFASPATRRWSDPAPTRSSSSSPPTPTTNLSQSTRSPTSPTSAPTARWPSSRAPMRSSPATSTVSSTSTSGRPRGAVAASRPRAACT